MTRLNKPTRRDFMRTAAAGAGAAAFSSVFPAISADADDAILVGGL
ncbi:MAG: twin-arginine translocation signal domain-containing protein, partial [Alphaproteobacteria bacterium]|nr:twin-arginine translocation signal domain-containing protein [Alphaproteobacteria bacterium]